MRAITKTTILKVRRYALLYIFEPLSHHRSMKSGLIFNDLPPGTIYMQEIFLSTLKKLHVV